jgi:fumarate reductase flavoprotein subunit
MTGSQPPAAGASVILSKRDLLKAGGALTLAMLTGTARQAFAQQQWDVIVVGGGTAGMPVAIFAAERGARVLVIDKAPILGGTLDRSTGQIAAAGSVFQKKKGIADSPDAHYDDIMRINGKTSDPLLCRMLVDNAADTINWLADNGFEALPEHPVTGGAHEHFTTARYLWGDGGGQAIFATMEPLFNKQVQAGNITVLTSTAVVDLVKSQDGAVLGVVAEDYDGQRLDLRGRYTVITSGGCAANPTMYHELHDTQLWTDMAYPFSQGDGITLGLGAGGYVRGGEHYAGLFSLVMKDKLVPSQPEGTLRVSPGRGRPIMEVFVNSRGERFVQEDHPSIDHREKAVVAQPGQRFWAIFDERILQVSPTIMRAFSREQMVEAFNSHPMFSKGESLTELGVRAGVHPAALARTVAEYNEAIRKGLPDPLGREERPMPIAAAPFYAVRAQSWTIVSWAGIAVDEQLRVIKENGQPVPNLYAAGEVIGGGATSGNAYTNGMFVTPALTFGRLLGSRILPLA